MPVLTGGMAGMAENLRALHTLATHYLTHLYPVSDGYDHVIFELKKFEEYEKALGSTGRDIEQLRKARQQALLAYEYLKITTMECHNDLHKQIGNAADSQELC